MVPILPYVKTQVFQNYYFKYVLGELLSKSYQFFYEYLSNNSI